MNTHTTARMIMRRRVHLVNSITNIHMAIMATTVIHTAIMITTGTAVIITITTGWAVITTTITTVEPTAIARGLRLRSP